MRQSETKKRNIIIGALCGVLLLMVVGYAAFNSVLNISGTSGISSNWKILITNIETKNIVGGATNASNPTGIGSLTATFNTNLVSPGDSIEYDITVTNQGSLNAVLEKINVSDSNNPAIKFTTTGIKQGDPLNAGDSAVLTVKVEYDNAVTSQPENTKSELTVTLDYVQEGTSTITPGGDTFTGTVYSYNVLRLTDYPSQEEAMKDIINVGDSLEKVKGHTEDYTTLNNNYFLKHNIIDGQVESSEVCFIKDGLHCLKLNEYEISKATLLSVFGESACDVIDSDVDCYDGSLFASADADGYMNASDLSVYCEVNGDGRSACVEPQEPSA